MAAESNDFLRVDFRRPFRRGGENRGCDILLTTKENCGLLIGLEHNLQFLQKSPLMVFQIKIVLSAV